jgi:hypothetical protein
MTPLCRNLSEIVETAIAAFDRPFVRQNALLDRYGKRLARTASNLPSSASSNGARAHRC